MSLNTKPMTIFLVNVVSQKIKNLSVAFQNGPIRRIQILVISNINNLMGNLDILGIMRKTGCYTWCKDLVFRWL